MARARAARAGRAARAAQAARAARPGRPGRAARSAQTAPAGSDLIDQSKTGVIALTADRIQVLERQYTHVKRQIVHTMASTDGSCSGWAFRCVRHHFLPACVVFFYPDHAATRKQRCVTR
jgi:hypothetical protein